MTRAELSALSARCRSDGGCSSSCSPRLAYGSRRLRAGMARRRLRRAAAHSSAATGLPRRSRALKSAHSRRDVPLSPGMARAAMGAGRRPAGTPTCSRARGRPLDDANVRRECWHRPPRRPGWRGSRSTPSGTHARRSCSRRAASEAGLGVAWSRRPRFTLRTYVHLMDEGMGDAAFMDAAVRELSSGANTDVGLASMGTLRERRISGGPGGKLADGERLPPAVFSERHSQPCIGPLPASRSASTSTQADVLPNGDTHADVDGLCTSRRRAGAPSAPANVVQVELVGVGAHVLPEDHAAGWSPARPHSGPGSVGTRDGRWVSAFCNGG